MVPSLSRQVFVTGAAGFIGSHLAERLLDLGLEVTGFDNLSTGRKSNLSCALKNPRFRFIQGDLLDPNKTRRTLGKCELVFHLAADPEVRTGTQHPRSHFEQNLSTTFNLLEAIRERATRTRLVFASTSTVYGEASEIPTPEDYGPMLPISTYGATKLGCEALAASYTQLAPLQVVIFRLANVVGSRARHGVTYDFIMKLLEKPQELEVLGDGSQTKSYLHVADCVDAFMMALRDGFWRDPVDVFNVGSEDRTNVLKIAEIVAGAMGLEGVTVRTTQSTGERAWPGDVKVMQLDISKIKKHGWKPKPSGEEAVRLATVQLAEEAGARLP